MKALAAFLVVGQAFDAVTLIIFMGMVPDGFHLAERNPIVLVLLALGGIQLFLLVKLSISVFVAYRWAFSGWRPQTRVGKIILPIMLPIAALLGWLGFAFNTVAIIQIQMLLNAL